MSWRVAEPGPGRWTTEGPWVDKSPAAPEPPKPPENGENGDEGEGDG